ncbi:Peptide-N(4)-(N-acetyl-beta- glucosaminyl)asparagine amidase, partial [Perkinsus olseni]
KGEEMSEVQILADDTAVYGLEVMWCSGDSCRQSSAISSSPHGEPKAHALTIEKGEYITEVTGRCGSWIDYLSIRTSNGREISAGGSGGAEFSILKRDDGKRATGFRVGFGCHMHNIGVYTVTVNDKANGGQPQNAAKDVMKELFTQYVKEGMDQNAAAAKALLETKRRLTQKSGKTVVGDLKPGNVYHPNPDDHRADSGGLDDRLVDHVVKTAEGGSVKDCIFKAEGFSAKYGGGLTLGDEKGEILSFTVATTKIPTGRDQLQILELGSHSGDGTLRFLKGVGKRKVKIVSVEENPHWLQLGKQLVSYAIRDPSTGKTKHTIRYKAMLMPEDMADLVESLQGSGMDRADIVFMDHQPGRFKQDLMKMVELGFAGPGTAVIVDNAGTKAAMMKDYLDLVQAGGATSSPSGPIKFNTVIQKVSSPYPDALAISWIGNASSEEL